MKDYIKKLKKLIDVHGKAKVAVELGVRDTNTINRWISRQLIPAKYLDLIKEMK